MDSKPKDDGAADKVVDKIENEQAAGTDEVPPAAQIADNETPQAPVPESELTKEQAQQKLDELRQQITAQTAYMKEANSQTIDFKS